MVQLSLNRRVRRSPFSDKVEAAGVSAYTVYNHMRLPTVFRSLTEDYAHLKQAVQLWDVSAERQVEIKGADAEKLVQMSTPRDLSRMADDQCYYIPTVNAAGKMTNDPVLNKIGADRFWVSLADSDLLLYYQGLAAGLKLDVEISEPNIHPLAIQGPKANELVERLFGAEYAATKFFRHKTVRIGQTDMILARSGWSVQGGFELYFDATEDAGTFWDRAMEAGRDLDIHAGCPNGIERIEGGLLSFGSDMTFGDTPYEAGLGKYCHDTPACLGHAALQSATIPERQIRAIEIAGDNLPACDRTWPLKDADGGYAGQITSAAQSPDFKCGVAIGMVEADYLAAGSELTVETSTGPRACTVRDKFWI